MEQASGGDCQNPGDVVSGSCRCEI
jgi:hypothetical protein